MRALYWNGRDLSFDPAYRIPKADERTALVKIQLAGICSTDLEIFKGYMGFQGVAGHEFVGTVSEGPKDLLDKRVVGEINFGCGTCDSCLRDLSRHCANRSVLGIVNADGAFAEFISIPIANLRVVPHNVSDEEAVFTEPLAAAFEILEQIQLNPGDEVLVLGDGTVGNLCAQVLRLTGASVTALGKHPDKLKLIKRAGMSAVRPRGTLVLKSTIADEYQVSLARLVINEITLVGSRCGVFAPVLEALE